MEILPIRIYAHEFPTGLRILIDRLWPRGISKEKAALDEWAKTIAPSTELREWFGHDPEKFTEFTKRYVAELDANPATKDLLTFIKASNQDRVLLLYAAKDTEDNNALVLADYLRAHL